MWTEDRTPVEQRLLWFHGKVSKKVKLTESGLRTYNLPNAVILFVGYAYADIPVGKKFHVVFPRGNPEAGIVCESEIIAVTQQFDKPLEVVPYGWKTICLVQFPRGVPEVVSNLPTVDGWFAIRDYVYVCDEETWEAVKRGGSGGRA
jgi:hypothetical protein